jgi:hypothetical protein
LSDGEARSGKRLDGEFVLFLRWFFLCGSLKNFIAAAGNATKLDPDKERL